ncbi:hypothetical protein SUGI_0482550 [Cryptomeria japonica]|nr:hypothetical protein SUGI_0482550 [Cryptomeria japonica]
MLCLHLSGWAVQRQLKHVERAFEKYPMAVTCDKKKGVAEDTSPREPVKWQTLEVDWDEYGVKQAEFEESNANTGGNLNHCKDTEKGSFTGGIEIDLTKSIENEKMIFDQHAIIAKFIGPKLSRKEIHAWVVEQWGGHIMIKFLCKGFFVAVFPNEDDRDHIINLQNWFRDEHPLYIQSWTPNFDPTSIAVYDKPVWIRLYNLLIEYWSKACLEMIERSLGMLLEIEEEIVEGDLYTYTRLKLAAIKIIPSSVMLFTVDEGWKQHIEIENEIGVFSRCGSKFHSTNKCRLFVRKAFKSPHRKPKQVWKAKEKTQVPETLLLEGPKFIKSCANQDISSEIPNQDIPMDGNLIPNNDIVVYPIEDPAAKEVLQESNLDTAESGSDDDGLNIVDPRHISQSANIILGRAKDTRGRKSHKMVRE